MTSNGAGFVASIFSFLVAVGAAAAGSVRFAEYCVRRKEVGNGGDVALVGSVPRGQTRGFGGRECVCCVDCNVERMITK